MTTMNKSARIDLISITKPHVQIGIIVKTESE